MYLCVPCSRKGFMTLTNYNGKITINNNKPKISHPYKNETTSCKQYVPCSCYIQTTSESYSTKYLFFFYFIIPKRLIFIWNGKLMEWKLGAKNVIRIKIYRLHDARWSYYVAWWNYILQNHTHKIWRWAKIQWETFVNYYQHFSNNHQCVKMRKTFSLD